jgi:hypothetical protein
MRRQILGLTAGAVLFGASAGFAQQQTVRVVGEIASVQGPTLVVKARDGELRVNVADGARVYGQEKATVTDLKVGDFVGVGAMPQPDGSQRAVQVTIFSESLRGNNERHGPWSSQPGGTMTNATIDQRISAVDGPVLMVKYKEGEKKIVIPPEASITRLIDSDRSELKPGARISIGSAAKKPDGTLEAARINVGRGGYAPN